MGRGTAVMRLGAGAVGMGVGCSGWVVVLGCGGTRYRGRLPLPSRHGHSLVKVRRAIAHEDGDDRGEV